ncbi:Metallo-beta-lactamase [Bombilactobacillus mellifer]|uniref:Metallo-beta-lactamase n=1 Tax=Bombilactobacillus mellifer TaxID=1218492 RepID=A0A0F4LRR3_9LACO|nr:MBL fold metallo-hydrolase [Bombilactobacillus mellifer]MBH9991932.1 MBL fold metallo-hydrolase [Lactobacillus sp. W8092]KJY60964.1 Metallo-beta-lactamase [Bombilactobacillus mellifer]MCT6826866.1 MBL fold metallo-hydrolase [Bombilactobacillus mellifer]MCT6843847.1 MBL fold metallo-hydrolase [Bombilactobacillus mellifer]MCT6894744.1 MBL fold metallo-hydrolase [Bombilactobacillus mellifer]
MKITVLGYYGGYPYRNRATSGYLIQEQNYNLLVDCGSGVLNALQMVLDPLQLDAVLLTHYHHDHIADVGVLQYYWQLHTGVKKEPILPIYGHTQDPLNFASLTLPDVTQGHGYSALEPLVLGPLTLTFLPTVHPVPAFAVRVTNHQSVLTYTADTAYFSQLAEFAAKSDILIADTNFPAEKTGQLWHLTSQQAGELAQQAQVKRLIISHLPQEYPLDRLTQQAQQAAGAVKVLRAYQGLKIVF